jgi:hypothetical protein
MKCSFCGERAEWRGPLSSITHTKCLNCGRINCETAEEDAPPVQSFQSPGTDPHEKDESRAGIPPFQVNAERRAVDVIL